VNSCCEHGVDTKVTSLRASKLLLGAGHRDGRKVTVRLGPNTVDLYDDATYSRPTTEPRARVAKVLVLDTTSRP